MGLRDDGLFFSISDSSGDEIENCEVLLCDEGGYVYQAYARNNAFDTVDIWVALLVQVVRCGISLVLCLAILPRQCATTKLLPVS